MAPTGHIAISAISSKLREAEGGYLLFRCPGCNEIHSIIVSKGGWSWNGDADKPTFSPSILLRGGHYAEGFGANGRTSCWCTFYANKPPQPGERVFRCVRCHFFVTNGLMQFLEDSTHALRGKTVPMPDFECAVEQR